MKIDRVIDWTTVSVIIVMDWIDFENNVGIEVETECSNKGKYSDFENGIYDLDKLEPIEDIMPGFNVFSDYSNFKQSRSWWLEAKSQAIVVKNIEKNDPILRHSFFENTNKIVEHIFEVGVIE